MKSKFEIMSLPTNIYIYSHRRLEFEISLKRSRAAKLFQGSSEMTTTKKKKKRDKI